MTSRIKQFLKKVMAILTLMIIASSCNGIQSGENLTESNKEYIRGLGLLDSKEDILLFETHSGKLINSFQTSGNFISDKRLASYWIDENNPYKTTIDFAYYNYIDTLILTDLSENWPSASYLTIKKKDGQEFKLYISGSSSEINDFFNQSINMWTKNKNGNGL